MLYTKMHYSGALENIRTYVLQKSPYEDPEKVRKSPQGAIPAAFKEASRAALNSAPGLHSGPWGALAIR